MSVLALIEIVIGAIKVRVRGSRGARRRSGVARGTALQLMSGGRRFRRADPGSGGDEPADFRKGMDGLAALVKEQLKADPFWA